MDDLEFYPYGPLNSEVIRLLRNPGPSVKGFFAGQGEVIEKRPDPAEPPSAPDETPDADDYETVEVADKQTDTTDLEEWKWNPLWMFGPLPPYSYSAKVTREVGIQVRPVQEPQQSQPQAEAEQQTETQGRTEAQQQIQAQQPTEGQQEPDAQPQTPAQPQAQAQGQVQNQAQAQLTGQAQLKGKNQPQDQAQQEGQTRPQTHPQPKCHAQPQAQAQPKAQSKAQQHPHLPEQQETQQKAQEVKAEPQPQPHHQQVRAQVSVQPRTQRPPQPRPQAFPQTRPMLHQQAPRFSQAHPPPPRYERYRRNHQQPLECSYCRQMGESPSFCRSHVLRDPHTHIVTCPILRAQRCEICGATGDVSHTRSHCPMRSEGNYNNVTVFKNAQRGKRGK